VSDKNHVLFQSLFDQNLITPAQQALMNEDSSSPDLFYGCYAINNEIYQGGNVTDRLNIPNIIDESGATALMTELTALDASA